MPFMNDLEVLIPGNEKEGYDGYAIHIGTRLFVICILFIHNSVSSLAITLLLLTIVAIQFWITENITGMKMIGLRWFFEFNPFRFSFYSKPDPYVPSVRAANVFWMTMIINAAGWFAGMVFELFLHSWFNFVICLIPLVAEAFNISFFMRAHALAKEEAEKNVLSAINNEQVPVFGMAKDEEEEYSSEEVNEEKIVEADAIPPIDDISDINDEEEEIPFDPELPSNE